MAKALSPEPAKTAEELRLDEAREKGVPWQQWGPYLSERDIFGKMDAETFLKAGREAASGREEARV
jgi:hypothetical protein